MPFDFSRGQIAQRKGSWILRMQTVSQDSKSGGKPPMASLSNHGRQPGTNSTKCTSPYTS